MTKIINPKNNQQNYLSKIELSPDKHFLTTQNFYIVHTIHDDIHSFKYYLDKNIESLLKQMKDSGVDFKLCLYKECNDEKALQIFNDYLVSIDVTFDKESFIVQNSVDLESIIKFIDETIQQPKRCIEIIKYDDTDIQMVKIGNDLYFKGVDCAKMLNYKRPACAIDTHIKPPNKFSFEYLKTNYNITAITNTHKHTLFINKFAFFSLIILSKMKNKEKIELWFNTNVGNVFNARVDTKNDIISKKIVPEDVLSINISSDLNIHKKYGGKKLKDETIMTTMTTIDDIDYDSIDEYDIIPINKKDVTNKTNREVAKNMLNMLDNVIKYGDSEIMYIKYDDEVWFHGNQLSNMLKYKIAKDAIHHHVDDSDKKKYSAFFTGVNSTPVNKSIRSSTYFINQLGVYSLIMRSSLPSAIQFKEWLFKEVLPSIKDTGKYNINGNDVVNNILNEIKTHMSACMSMNIISTYFKSVVYCGFIGTEDQYYKNGDPNIFILKYGLSDDVLRRTGEHKNSYKQFNLIYVSPCTNHKFVESVMKKHCKFVDMKYELTINGKKDMETLYIDSKNNQHNIGSILSTITELIDMYPSSTDIKHKEELSRLDIEKQIMILDNELKQSKLEIKYMNQLLESKNDTISILKGDNDYTQADSSKECKLITNVDENIEENDDISIDDNVDEYVEEIVTDTIDNSVTNEVNNDKCTVVKKRCRLQKKKIMIDTAHDINETMKLIKC